MTIPSIPQEDITTIILSKKQIDDLIKGFAMLYIYPKGKMLQISSAYRDDDNYYWPGKGTVIKTIGVPK